MGDVNDTAKKSFNNKKILANKNLPLAWNRNKREHNDGDGNGGDDGKNPKKKMRFEKLIQSL